MWSRKGQSPFKCITLKIRGKIRSLILYPTYGTSIFKEGVRSPFFVQHRQYARDQSFGFLRRACRLDLVKLKRVFETALIVQSLTMAVLLVLRTRTYHYVQLQYEELGYNDTIFCYRGGHHVPHQLGSYQRL